jgi:FkbM family methyltransferase
MNSTDLLTSLKKSVFLSKGTKAEKIRKSPIKLPYSLMLQFITQKLKKSLTVKGKTFWGEDMYLAIPEVVSMNIFRYGFFEEGLTRMLLKYLKSGMVFFDIGTHFGYFTLLASFLVGDRGQVYSFEPTPSTFEMLKLNISGKKNIVINNCAVSSEKKKVTFNDYGIQYSAFNSLYNPKLPENIRSKLNVKQHVVESLSIDAYIENDKLIPNFIKIDAESAEYQILCGMEKTIKKFQPIISVEIGDFNIEGIPPSHKLIDFLIKNGYQPYEFKDGEIIKHELKKEYLYDNILFLPVV